MPRRRKSRLSKNPWLKKKLLRRLETPEKRALRLEKARKHTANRRARETEEEREERLTRNREAARTRRANIKSLKRKTELGLQWNIELLENNCQNHTFKERVAKQKVAMFQEMNSVNYNLLRNGILQNNTLQMMYHQQHLAYEAVIGQTISQSQFQQKLMKMCPKTPEHMLQLGLVACPSEETVSDIDDNENDCSVGVECEVTIEEGGELEDIKLFKEENPPSETEIHELPICSPPMVEYRHSNVQRNIAVKESVENKKLSKEEIL